MASMSKAKPENRALPKRFYTAVAVQQSADGFGIALDGKLLRTQGRNPLHVASQQLAGAIADEWEAQAEFINPDTMPLARLINLTIDRVPADRAALLMELARYGQTDLVCYRAPQDAVIARQSRSNPASSVCETITLSAPNSWIASALEGPRNDESLRQRQDTIFTPILDWLRAAYGIDLAVTEGVMPVAQSTASQQRMAALFAEASDGQLAALCMMVPLLGSAVLALAVWKGRIAVEEALIAARLDEDFQAEKWGADPLAVAAWEAKARDVRASGFFLTHNALK